jgi:hypothetical protein
MDAQVTFPMDAQVTPTFLVPCRAIPARAARDRGDQSPGRAAVNKANQNRVKTGCESCGEHLKAPGGPFVTAGG